MVLNLVDQQIAKICFPSKQIKKKKIYLLAHLSCKLKNTKILERG